MTISGSFRKHFEQILETIDLFRKAGLNVLSPQKSRVVNPDSEFVILQSDKTDDIFTIEQTHLDAIKRSALLYVFNPGGYIGLTVAMEIGWAHAHGIPVICFSEPCDIVVKEFCCVVMTAAEAAEHLKHFCL